MNEDLIERMGQLIDTVDNLLAAAVLALPDKMHAEGLRVGLQAIRVELLSVYTEAGGSDEWSDSL